MPNAAARSQSGACGSSAPLDPPPPSNPEPRKDEVDSNPPILSLRFRSSAPRINKSSAVSVALSDDEDEDDDDDDEDEAKSNGCDASSCW